MVHGSLFIAFLLHSISLLIISCFVLRGWVSRQAKYGSHPAKKILVRPPRGAVARRPSAIRHPPAHLQSPTPIPIFTPSASIVRNLPSSPPHPPPPPSFDSSSRSSTNFIPCFGITSTMFDSLHAVDRIAHSGSARWCPSVLRTSTIGRTYLRTQTYNPSTALSFASTV